MTSELPSPRPFVWAWLIFIAVVLGLAIYIWEPARLIEKMDFRAMYVAGTLARTDPSHLYDPARQKELEDVLVEKHDVAIPFGHLAYDALLFVPFSLMKYRNAYFSMLLLNAGLIALCFLVARKEFSTLIPLWQPRPGFVFFAFIPTIIALAQGQDSMVLLLILCLTWRLLSREAYFAAGLVLANLLLKPHLALILALLLAARYGWRLVAGFVTGGAAVALICLRYWVHGGFQAWLHVILGLSLTSGNGQAQQVAMGIYPWAMPNIRGALLWTFGRVIPARGLFAADFVLSAALLLWGLLKMRRVSSRNAFAFSVVVTVLVSYNFEAHDLVLLLLPLVLMETTQSWALRRTRDLILALPIGLLLFFPANPPGAGFTLMCVPLFAAAYLIGKSRRAHSQGPELAIGGELATKG